MKAVIVWSAGILLAACTAQGPADNPFLRKFTWFSYLGGEDIRAACVSGGGDRYRFVYNGVYTEQVRAYDLSPLPGGRFRLDVRVTETADIRTFGGEAGGFDALKPWRPVKSTVDLPETDAQKLEMALRADGLLAGNPPEQKLRSIDFYWTVGACIDGRYHFNAAIWPAQGFAALRFPALLRAWDFTDIPLNPPRQVSLFDLYGTNDPDDHFNTFEVQYDGNGRLLRGI